MHPLPIEIVETLLRSAAIGELLLFGMIYARRPLTGKALSLLAVAACVIGYLFLAMPVIAPERGFFRGLFLVLTDTLPYAIWLAAMYWLKDDFQPARWNAPVKTAVAAWAVAHVYFLGVRQGGGAYHDANHAVAILLMLHVIYVAVSELADDLVESRRKARVVAAILASLFVMFIAAAQLFPPFIDARFEGAINAAIVLAGVTVLAPFLLLRESPPAAAPSPVAPADPDPLRSRLDAFIATGGYRQPELTIKALADALGCQEYQLRRLINGTLGYRNFSAFLNEHRIRDARAQLERPGQEPILTLALNLGYGSIGPFNRAFKAATGLTPSEYRQSFQNRPAVF